jgi:uncharacterized protein with FMN-binding domain
MRSVVLALGGTIAGLTLLLSFKSHSSAPPGDPVAAAMPATQASPRSQASPRAPGRPRSSAPAARSRTAAATRTVTGNVDSTAYGPMQVQLTLTGQKITKATVVQRTDSGEHSAQIDSFAVPKLISETLAAQNGRIDAVSGATYTSSGYITSLQSALDKAAA